MNFNNLWRFSVWDWCEIHIIYSKHIANYFNANPTLKATGYLRCHSKTYFSATRSRYVCFSTLQWRHNGRDSVSNHQPHGCLLNRLFRRRSKKTSKFRVTGLFVRGIHRGPVNSTHKWPVTRKMFPFDDVIMKSNIRGSQSGTVNKRVKRPYGVVLNVLIKTYFFRVWYPPL